MTELTAKSLQLWPESIDISDGEIKSGFGFYSYNLTIAWWDADEKACKDDDIRFMVGAIFGALCKIVRKKFINGEHIVSIRELNVDDIEQRYQEAVKRAGLDFSHYIHTYDSRIKRRKQLLNKRRKRKLMSADQNRK